MRTGTYYEKFTGKAFTMACSRQGSLAIVKVCLERPEVKQRVVNLQNQDGSTPLSTAVRDNSTHITRLLLVQDGINVNLQDTRGRSALHFALEMGQSLELAQLLLQHPMILPNAQGFLRRTPTRPSHHNYQGLLCFFAYRMFKTS